MDAIDRILAENPVGPVTEADMLATVADIAHAGEFWDQFDNGVIERGRTLPINEGPLYSPNQWDQIRLGVEQNAEKVFLPGVWKVSSTPSIKLDVQKPAGFDGAAIIQRGYVPGRLDIEGKIWTKEQWKAWLELLPKLWRRPDKVFAQDSKAQTKAQKNRSQAEARAEETAQSTATASGIVVETAAFPVFHPALAAMNISSIVIESISVPRVTSDPGVMEILIRAVEYVPTPPRQKSGTKVTKGSKGPSTNALTNPPPTAIRAPNDVEFRPSGPTNAAVKPSIQQAEIKGKGGKQLFSGAMFGEIEQQMGGGFT